MFPGSCFTGTKHPISVTILSPAAELTGVPDGLSLLLAVPLPPSCGPGWTNALRTSGSPQASPVCISCWGTCRVPCPALTQSEGHRTCWSSFRSRRWRRTVSGKEPCRGGGPERVERVESCCCTPSSCRGLKWEWGGAPFHAGTLGHIVGSGVGRGTGCLFSGFRGKSNSGHCCPHTPPVMAAGSLGTLKWFLGPEWEPAPCLPP